MPKFKIFYSWQSDLPGNKTRRFIRDCIDDAIAFAEESEAVEAVRDEATKDTTGSPNIVTTLFSKIDECDLFIADLSLCFSGNVTKNQDGTEIKKHSPNPNVLLELGYAVKTLTWDRVICLCNTDFGNDFPFDIAQNRRTSFSLEGKNKADVQKNITKIIFTNIQTLKGQIPRAKTGMANHIIGAYDFDQHKVEGKLVPLLIAESNCYKERNTKLLETAQELFAELHTLTQKIETEKAKLETSDKSASFAKQSEISSINQSIECETIHEIAELFKGTGIPVVWETEAQIQDKKNIKQFIGVDVSDSFFDLYNLKQTKEMWNRSELKGTDDEKSKYYKLQDFTYILQQLEIRTEYIKTFEGLLFIPLAIQNISDKQDGDIRIVVNVELGEIIEPNKQLVCSSLQGIQGMLCRNDEDENDVGVIAEMFILPEDSIINTEKQQWTPELTAPRIPALSGYVFSQPEKTKEDYELELMEYIATTDGRGYYEFLVKSLCPNECRWLSTGMLIKPIEGNVLINYHIYSAHSNGELSGRLELG